VETMIHHWKSQASLLFDDVIRFWFDSKKKNKVDGDEEI
jgi:hypothetical protein